MTISVADTVILLRKWLALINSSKNMAILLLHQTLRIRERRFEEEEEGGRVAKEEEAEEKTEEAEEKASNSRRPRQTKRK